MLEYLTRKVDCQSSCGECGMKDYRALRWRVNKWLCENCNATQKHSLAAETLANASKRIDK